MDAEPKHTILRQTIGNESDAGVMALCHRLETDAKRAWDKYVLVHAAWKVAQDEAERRLLIETDNR